MMFLYMLRYNTPTETHGPDVSQFTLILNMSSLVISMFFNMIMFFIIIDSFGPDGSYASSYYRHNEVIVDFVGRVAVFLLTTAAMSVTVITCISCCPALKEHHRQGVAGAVDADS